MLKAHFILLNHFETTLKAVPFSHIFRSLRTEQKVKATTDLYNDGYSYVVIPAN